MIWENKSDIKLTHLTEDVRSIFQITRLDRVFEIFDDAQEAVNSFYGKP
jgi:anti-anti-sigma regulatory factor